MKKATSVLRGAHNT